MKRLISKYTPEIIGVTIGLIAGWCYWYFIGCSSGSCAITSKPLNSALYGALMGGLLSGVFGKNKNNKKEQNEKFK